MVNACRVQLAQILMNLCVNSMDAIQNEHGKIEIKVRKVNPAEDEILAEMVSDSLPESDALPLQSYIQEQKNGGLLKIGQLARDISYVVISVSDNGGGIPANLMENMFEPFFTTKALYEGTGLGLSSVHGIVMAHQGAIVVQSKHGEGTTFKVYIPLGKMGEDGAQESKAHWPIVGQGHIMLVEDEDNVREMLTEMISRLGYKVSPFPNALQAVDALRENIGTLQINSLL